MTVVVAVALLVFAGVVAAGSSSAACRSCHRTLAVGTDHSAHASVSCYRCHLESGWWDYPAFKMQELTRMYPAALTGRTVADGPTSRVGTRPCLDCHRQVFGPSVVAANAGLKVKHAACARSATSCSGCHPASSHGKASRAVNELTMERCVACHARKSATRECNACHDDRTERERLTSGPFQVTHGPSWRTTHGMGDLKLCSTCHEPASCVKCHGIVVPHPSDFGATHGSAAKTNRAACSTCHVSATFCENCHQGEPMPHPVGFLERHPKIATPKAQRRCLACHTAEDCETCHRRHVHPGGSRGLPPRPRQSGQSTETTVPR